tara:strand:- start:51 stop:455 length:405 start_codon:yes stop_codon:yes gene_type:complete
MNKNELKKILKPLIKECIKEVIFEEDGALSHIIKEVAVGLSGKQRITEVKHTTPTPPPKRNNKLKQQKKRLLDAIGKEAYGGVNIFEGTTPAPAQSSGGQGPLSDVAGDDPGVDISSLFGSKSASIYQKMMEKK